jgi:hypothetical protein
MYILLRKLILPPLKNGLWAVEPQHILTINTSNGERDYLAFDEYEFNLRMCFNRGLSSVRGYLVSFL